MAKIHKDSILNSVDGPIGNLTVVHDRRWGILRSRPVDPPKATPRRKAHRSRFGQASKFASSVLGVPEVAAIYIEAAKGTDFSGQNLAIADFMHGPTIEDIDLSSYTGRSGQTVRVRAKDTAEVPVPLYEVRVVIRGIENDVLENGHAELHGGVWEYVTQAAVASGQIVKIEVTAADRPGNRATKSVPHLTQG